jgi:hypothetical protein
MSRQHRKGTPMRRKGINYDTGFSPGGSNTRPTFDADAAGREMRVIAEDLHCTSVRISGGDPERLSATARHAVAAGLEVWFSPQPCELTAERLRPYLADCARRAEDLRRGGGEIVLVLGCELTFFGAGFIPGEDGYARLKAATAEGPEVDAMMDAASEKLNAFFTGATADARAAFGGPLTYASGPWEKVDWTPFDLVGVDAYRSADNAETYREDLRAHRAHGKPVVATEFGCCTYRGAAERGAMGWAIVDKTATPRRLDDDYERDEGEQAAYLRELLGIFEEEDLDGAFWFSFASFDKPHAADPRHDLDMASYGVVKVHENGWDPKESFHALAAAYGGGSR